MSLAERIVDVGGIAGKKHAWPKADILIALTNVRFRG
jgi:hypothetical protein